MAAEVVPFPLARRVAFIRKQASSMAARSCGLAEKYLALQMRIQASALSSRGVDAQAVAREVEAMERAIRVELTAMLAKQKGGAA